LPLQSASRQRLAGVSQIFKALVVPALRPQDREKYKKSLKSFGENFMEISLLTEWRDSSGVDFFRRGGL
jgi:hypothetical protein